VRLAGQTNRTQQAGVVDQNCLFGIAKKILEGIRIKKLSDAGMLAEIHAALFND
jgi:hypothetical protein